MLLPDRVAPDGQHALHARVEQAFAQHALPDHARCSKQDDVHLVCMPSVSFKSSRIYTGPNAQFGATGRYCRSSLSGVFVTVKRSQAEVARISWTLNWGTIITNGGDPVRNTVDIEKVRSWVDRAARVVVLTGADISTESGIPDFRGPQG